MIEFLKTIKDCFKVEKATLFVIDRDLQKFAFKNKKERMFNYKKIMVNGNETMHALYVNEDDFYGPLFKSTEEAGCHIMNNKAIIVPIKYKKITYMSLQLIYKVNMKVTEFNHTKTKSTSKTPKNSNNSNAK